MDAVEQSRSRAGTAYGTLSERALRALLDSDRIAGCVVVSRLLSLPMSVRVLCLALLRLPV